MLKEALSSPLRAFATKLVSVESCWTVDHKLLKVWKKVQTALYPPKPEGEDEEEPEPVDVADEEWQAGVAAEVYGEDNPDGKFFVQQVVKLGCYTGERSAADEQVEPSFDGELMPREGYGLALMPKGAVYAGHFVAGAREGTGVYKYMDGACYCKP